MSTAKTWEALRAAAFACKGWAWPDRMRDENGTHHFGKRRDGEFYEIGTIDASTYTGEYVDDIRVMKFIRAAQPEAILKLVDALAASERRNLELERVHAERGLQIERLDVALARAAAVRPCANLRQAVGAFIKAKGRFHTEQGYKALVAAFDAAALAEETLP